MVYDHPSLPAVILSLFWCFFLKGFLIACFILNVPLVLIVFQSYITFPQHAAAVFFIYLFLFKLLLLLISQCIYDSSS